MLALLGRIVGKAVAEAVIEEYNIEKNDLEGLKNSFRKHLAEGYAV